MFIPSIITGCVILYAGIFMFRKGRKKTQQLTQYEKDNRNPDGSIYFKDVALSRTHGANKNLSMVVTIMGFFTTVFGIILITYGLNIFSYP